MLLYSQIFHLYSVQFYFWLIRPLCLNSAELTIILILAFSLLSGILLNELIAMYTIESMQVKI